MRKNFDNVWGAVVAGLAAFAVLIGALADTGSAVAGPKRVVGGSVDDNVARLAAAAVNHQSIIKVDDRAGPVHKSLKIGLGKSLLLEFSRDLRDVLVSNPEAVDAVILSSNRVFLLAKKNGETNAFFFDSNGEQFASFELFVQRDPIGLTQMLSRLIPSSEINVEILNDTVILTGNVKTPADSNTASRIAENFASLEFRSTSAPANAGVEVTSTTKKDPKDRVINMLAVEGEEQVMLRVVVAEVQRSALKQFGVNLGTAINSGNFAINALTSNALPLTSAQGLGSLPSVGLGTGAAAAAGSAVSCSTLGVLCNYNSGPSATAFGNSGISGGWASGGNQIGYTLRALEREGLVKTLAEPNLTAVSGEAAKFIAGGEFPVPTVDNTGQTNVTFKEYGVGVAFTPIVMSEGRISLKIETEVSELTSQGAVTIANIQIPALKKRQSKSTVELPSGGSIAMSGLISEDTRQNVDGFPGIKELPILGTLFRSRDFIKNETELVIIVTPYLVKPTARKELARPLDGLGDPTDLKGNFLGHLNRIYGRNTALPAGDLKGDYGFIVE